MNAGMFSNQPWKIILELFSAHLKGKNISVNSAILKASVPLTTGLRWMAALEKAGFVARSNDQSDEGRALVKITPDAIAELTQVLADTPE